MECKMARGAEHTSEVRAYIVKVPGDVASRKIPKLLATRNEFRSLICSLVYNRPLIA